MPLNKSMYVCSAEDQELKYKSLDSYTVVEKPKPYDAYFYALHFSTTIKTFLNSIFVRTKEYLINLQALLSIDFTGNFSPARLLI